MIKFLDKFFLRSNNLNYLSKSIKELTKNSEAYKIFDAINSYSEKSEIRYVGGCIRKIINNEKVDDIDLASNLEPQQVCEALKKKNISYFETGIEHGTITAVINKKKFEITSLRKDISTDGRHAIVKFTDNWKEDALRRDFTINSIYSDRDGNLFDPFDGKRDIENGIINFVGDADKRIKEDYLRILRYIRFFLNYSKKPHNLELIRKLKINIDGVSKLSKERLLMELKKIIRLETLEKLNKDNISADLILIIFPELKNIKVFSKLNQSKRDLLKQKNFIFLISLLIIDKTDNTEYFFYRFNLSKKDQKRISIIDNFYKDMKNKSLFTETNLNRIFYYHGKQAINDILHFEIIMSQKSNKKIIDLNKMFLNKTHPVIPVSAEVLMKKYKISEGKQIGEKLKMIEEKWIENNFQISDIQVENIVNN